MTTALDELLAAIARRWPALHVDRERLAARLEERGLSPASPRAADVALVCALADGDPVALAAFDAEIVPDIRGAVVRYGRDEDFVAETIQRVRVKLLVGDAPRIVEYGGRGPLAAWIQIVAIREALMMLRGQRREVSADDELVRLAVTEPVLARSRQVYKGAFAQAFREALAALEERERTLLRLCFGEGLATEDLARLFRIHRVTAFRWLRDARARLLELTRDRFLAAADIPPSEIDSVMRSLASSLSVAW